MNMTMDSFELFPDFEGLFLQNGRMDFVQIRKLSTFEC